MISLIETLRKSISGVEGWLAKEEGELLYSLAKTCRPDHCIVEIGSWKGKSAIYLATGAKAGLGAQLYAVDPHQGANQEKTVDPIELEPTLDAFMNNIRDYGVDKFITPIVNTSEYAATYIVKKPVGLIFVDGLHTYDGVVNDIRCWYPLVAKEGFMAFHDSVPGNSWEEVEKAVQQYIVNSGLFSDIHYLHCITYGRKK